MRTPIFEKSISENAFTYVLMSKNSLKSLINIFPKRAPKTPFFYPDRLGLRPRQNDFLLPTQRRLTGPPVTDLTSCGFQNHRFLLEQGVPLISTGVGKNNTFVSPFLKGKGHKIWCFFTLPPSTN